MTEPAIQPWEWCSRCKRPLGTIARTETTCVMESWPVEDRHLCWECYKVHRDEIGDPLPPHIYRMTEYDLLEEYRRRGMRI